ncbi:TonB-dependent receptor [Parablastomonas sp. CN1-191]|uniref:TonB-dependent receptor n=1 Tax=Parablastomonas sp. CN1-191 TaxID=3400908 RepID=UPI003BF78A21
MTITARSAVSCLALGFALAAAPAFAQEEEAKPATAADQTADAGNEIIVTATKREQTLQDTPVAVSVTTADTIERAQIRDVKDLATLVPSLKVSQSQSQFATTYTIRGFGTSGNNIGLEPSVAMFVDGVYRSRAVAQISDLPDIQRVEVLRGPQSTLFGKNASAGVISIVTKEPSFSPGGSVEASYGNYNAVVLKGYLTGGITDTIAASLAAGYNRRDGYITNAFNGDDLNDRNRWFGRAQLRIEPSDSFKIRLIGDYDQIDEKCCAVSNLRPSAATLAVQALGGKVNDYRRPYDDIVYSDVVPFSKVRNWGLSGQMDYEVGPLTFTSITAYRDTKLDANQDVDFTSAALASGATIGQSHLKTFTQELRMATNLEGPLNFLLGGYYFDEKVKSADQITYGKDFRHYIELLTGQSAATLEATFGVPQNTFWQPGQGFFNNVSQRDKAYSLFGNADFKVTDKLTLTLGANYTHDAKDVTTNSKSTDVFSGIDLVAARAQINQVGIARTVGGFLGLPAGTAANAAQIAFFQSIQPAAYTAIVNGVSAQTAPLLGLAAVQFLPPFQNIPNAVESGKSRDGDWSWTARLAYEISNTLNAYVSYSTGFKASSWNLSRDSKPLLADYNALRAAGLAVVNLKPGSRFALPEDSTVYELGLKANWGIASANLTFFKQSIKNFQTNTFVGAAYVFGNADKESTFGIEFDGRVNPTKELTLSMAMTYLDPRYDSYPGSIFGDVSGEQVVGISKLAATLGAQWNHELGNADHLIARVDFNYQAPVQVEPGLVDYITTNPNGTPNYATARMAAYEFRREVSDLNGSLTYAMKNGLELSVWGRNLLDNRYLQDIFDSVAQNKSVSGYVNQPRTYGVAARFKF